MAFLDLARARYSVRKFSEKPLEREKLEQVLEAGRLAPTACNYQPQRILVAESAEALEKIRRCTPCSFGAPAVLVICFDKNVSAKHEHTPFDIGIVDASIVATHLMLAAADLGLGTTWVENFDFPSVMREFALPENLVPTALLPLGYPAPDAAPNKKLHFSRKPLAETVFYNRLP